jgi:predicted acetyltransferase
MRYAASLVEAAAEFQTEGRMTRLEISDVESYTSRLRAMETEPPPGLVPESFFWLVESDADIFIGRISKRHNLNDALRQIGGNIGYEIRTSYRKKGYGTLMLKLALPEARKLKLDRVMLTCDSTNVGSRKIIEANGGVLEREIEVPNHAVSVLHWWITL